MLTNREDPTRTKTLRNEYARRLRGHLSRLNTVIRSGVRDRDIFGINQSDPTEPPSFRFRSDGRKTDEFMAWLRGQEERGILEEVSRDNNPYVRAAYQRGLQHAEDESRDVGLVGEPAAVNRIFNQPRHRDAAQQLYTRNFEELEGITSEMNRQISRELTDGFAQGRGPADIARGITDRVDSIGKNRATVMARTEMINAHTEAALNRYEQHGVGRVTVRAEIITAGDRRVCPQCNSLSGEVFEIQTVRTDTFTFDGSQFPVKPPIHPQCRCAIVPVT